MRESDRYQVRHEDVVVRTFTRFMSALEYAQLRNKRKVRDTRYRQGAGREGYYVYDTETRQTAGRRMLPS